MKKVEDYLEYDPNTGKVIWKKKTSKYSKIKIGDEAGGINNAGYRRIGFDGILKYTTHWIWMLVYGRFPLEGMEIDHINGNKSDNRLSNLREVTISGNQQNKINNREDLFVYPKTIKYKDREYHYYEVKMQMKHGEPETYIGCYKDYNEAVVASAQAQIDREIENGFVPF